MVQCHTAAHPPEIRPQVFPVRTIALCIAALLKNVVDPSPKSIYIGLESPLCINSDEGFIRRGSRRHYKGSEDITLLQPPTAIFIAKCLQPGAPDHATTKRLMVAD